MRVPVPTGRHRRLAARHAGHMVRPEVYLTGTYYRLVRPIAELERAGGTTAKYLDFVRLINRRERRQPQPALSNQPSRPRTLSQFRLAHLLHHRPGRTRPHTLARRGPLSRALLPVPLTRHPRPLSRARALAGCPRCK